MIAADPAKTLLAFLESAYATGAGAAGWDARELTSPGRINRPEVDGLRAESDPGARLVLDGNAIAGQLVEVFGVELTIAAGECATCSAEAPLAESDAYVRQPGTILRCRSCGSALMVLVGVRRTTTCVDLRGLARIESR